MNLTSAATLLPSLENMFGQVHGWTLPTTDMRSTSCHTICQFQPSFDTIEIGVFKCTAAQFAFLWFHEAFHFVQFTLQGIDSDRYYEALKAFDNVESGKMYYWITEEREANMDAYEMCKRMGLTDFIPQHIPAGYFD